MTDLLKSHRETDNLSLGTYQIIQILNAYGIPYKPEFLISEGDESSSRMLQVQTDIDLARNPARNALEDVISQLGDSETADLIREICKIALPRNHGNYAVDAIIPGPEDQKTFVRNAVPLKIGALLHDLLKGSKKKPKAQIALGEARLEAALNMQKIGDARSAESLTRYLFSFEPLWLSPAVDRGYPMYNDKGELLNYDTTPDAIALYVQKALLHVIPELLYRADEKTNINPGSLFIANELLIGATSTVLNSRKWWLTIQNQDGSIVQKLMEDFYLEAMSLLEKFLKEQIENPGTDSKVVSMCGEFLRRQFSYSLDVIKKGVDGARQSYIDARTIEQNSVEPLALKGRTEE